mmetsp:Transcript_6326/g.21780  ORF Transcript_6326/g.21780 Transcript_6326/m.21780 type:complete len:212 (-) Transcript_6326:49-684(-)
MYMLINTTARIQLQAPVNSARPRSTSSGVRSRVGAPPRGHVPRITQSRVGTLHASPLQFTGPRVSTPHHLRHGVVAASTLGAEGSEETMVLQAPSWAGNNADLAKGPDGKTNVCIVGGGNAAHVLVGYLGSRPDELNVRLLDDFSDEAARLKAVGRQAPKVAISLGFRPFLPIKCISGDGVPRRAQGGQRPWRRCRCCRRPHLQRALYKRV